MLRGSGKTISKVKSSSNRTGCIKNILQLSKGKHSGHHDDDVNKRKSGIGTHKTSKSPGTSEGEIKHVTPAKRSKAGDEVNSQIDCKRKANKEKRDGTCTVTTATFEEDGDTVELEVRGQSTDFASETKEMEQGEITDSEDEEDEVYQGESSNNNATKINDRQVVEQPEQYGNTTMDQSDAEEEVTIRKRTEEEIKAQEELEMQKFVNFMKKQGLVLVDTNALKQKEEKSNGRQTVAGGNQWVNTVEKQKHPGMETDFIDNSSIITVYKNAVQPIEGPALVVKLTDHLNKRGSTSSEDALDTSNKIDKLPVNDIELTRERNINQFISDIRRHSTENSDMLRMSVVDKGRTP